jgi:hypothetical protein
MSEVIHWQALTPEQRDALVAEKVMEQRIHVEPAGETEYDLALVINDAAGVARIEPIPRYTQSLDAAWLVVERIEDANVTVTHIPRAYQRCTIEFYDGNRIEVFENTAPEAICVAALRAVGCGIVTYT